MNSWCKGSSYSSEGGVIDCWGSPRIITCTLPRLKANAAKQSKHRAYGGTTRITRTMKR